MTVVAALIGGILLLVLGVRGKRLNDHPICRKCRFDLVGLPASARGESNGSFAATAKCPECGSVLDRRRAVRVGARRKRWWFILGGPALFLVVLSVQGLRISGWMRGHNWGRYKPTSMLLWEADRGSPFAVDAAVHELVSRLKRDQLSPDAVDVTSELALRAQTVLTTDNPWGAWSFWFGEVIDRGKLTEAQMARCLERSWSPRVTIPRKARCEATIELGLTVYKRSSTWRNAWIHETRVRFDGPGGERLEVVAPKTSYPVNSRGGTGLMVAAPGKPGHYVVTATFLLDVFDRRTPGVILERREVSVRAPLELLERNERPVRLTPDESLAAAVKASLKYSRAHVRMDGEVPILDVRAEFRETPVNLAFSLTVRQGGHEWNFGAGGSRPWRPDYMTFHREAPVPGLRPGDVELIFTATQEALRETVDLNDEAWGGRIVLESVAVEWPNPSATPTASPPE